MCSGMRRSWKRRRSLEELSRRSMNPKPHTAPTTRQYPYSNTEWGRRWAAGEKLIVSSTGRISLPRKDEQLHKLRKTPKHRIAECPSEAVTLRIPIGRNAGWIVASKIEAEGRFQEAAGWALQRIQDDTADAPPAMGGWRLIAVLGYKS